jgi:L-fucose isomerase-like protein
MQKSAQYVSSPLGILILGRKRPGFDQEWNQIVCKRSLATLRDLGFSCVGAESPVVDDQTLHTALHQIHQAKCKALLLLQPSIGNGQLALTVAQHWPDPIVLWATPERPGDGKVSSCSLVGQHLWASVLRQADHPFEFVYGDADDAEVRAELIQAIALCRTFRFLRHAKVGVIGTHVPGFIDLAADPFLLRRKLGIQLHPLSLPQYIERVRTIPEDTVEKDIQQVRALGLKLVNVTEDALDINSRCYLAMLEIMQEESLHALAIQCWPEIPNMLGQWPYLAVSRLSSAGHAIAIEGDVDGSIASLMSSSLGMGPGFLTDWLEHDASTIFFWHPGMAPLDMCHAIGSDEGPTLGAHFNVVKPFVIDGQLQSGQNVTVMRLWRCDNEYHMTAFEGRSIPPQRRITGNSMLVEVAGGDVPRRFERLLHAGMPHHVLLHFGNQADNFRRLARLLHVQWHE